MADTITQQFEPATTKLDWKETEVGSVFVSNYPPYSLWNTDAIEIVNQKLNRLPQTGVPLGLYMHIPFCRKRCKFCYFRVYTDKNSQDIQSYLEALAKEIELYSKKNSVDGRSLKFVYFGGGTPSYISAKHLQSFVSRVKSFIPWDRAEEVTFECEPGTLTETKIGVIREIGVTRLSLGIENFNDRILEENGRAHLSEEIFRCLPWIKAQDFDQLNIDLIAGMVGETWETWKESVQQTIDIDPESVTIYQMELPFNTVYSKNILGGNGHLSVADWKLKREWHLYAIEQLEKAGYTISSAYTMVKKDKLCRFVYRDSVWQGCDLLGTGVASFSHVNGVHFQNTSNWAEYLRSLEQQTIPIARSFEPNMSERLTRELILQLKLGKLDTAYFQQKYDVDIVEQFRDALDELQREDMLRYSDRQIQLTRQGLLRVDQLLPAFYDEKYRNARYT